MLHWETDPDRIGRAAAVIQACAPGHRLVVELKRREEGLRSARQTIDQGRISTPAAKFVQAHCGREAEQV